MWWCRAGVGTIAECIAAGKRLVWPPREGFREDEVTRVAAPRYLRMVEMPVEPFRAGEWRGALERVMVLAEPGERMLVEGAEACARFIAERVAN